MAYVALGAEVAFDYEGSAKKCATAANVDWDTKAGREKGTTDAASCAAEAACAYVSGGATLAAGGICGTIGGKIVGTAIGVWNSLFGDEEAQRKERERQRQAAHDLANTARIHELDNLLSLAVGNAVGRLAVFNDAILPWRKGRFGKNCKAIQDPPLQLPGGHVVAFTRWVCADFSGIDAGKRMLQSFGAPLINHPTTKAPVTEQFYGDYLALIAKYKPASATVQNWLKSVDNAVQLGMASVDRAEYKARAALIAEKAAHDALTLAAQKGSIIVVAQRASERERRLQQAGALLLLGGAAVSAFLIWKRRRR